MPISYKVIFYPCIMCYMWLFSINPRLFSRALQIFPIFYWPESHFFIHVARGIPGWIINKLWSCLGPHQMLACQNNRVKNSSSWTGEISWIFVYLSVLASSNRTTMPAAAETGCHVHKLIYRDICMASLKSFTFLVYFSTYYVHFCHFQQTTITAMIADG